MIVFGGLPDTGRPCVSFCKRTLILSVLSLLVVQPASWAKKQEAQRFVTLSDGDIATILGASREPHTMTSLKGQGAPAEYVNEDLGEIHVNEGPCTFVAMQGQPEPDALYEVFIECFDLVAERERKSFSYATDSTGKVVRAGSLTTIGDYAMGDPLFDHAAWNWTTQHVSSELKKKIAEDRARGNIGLPPNLYKVNAKGEHGGPRVTAPVLTWTRDAVFSEQGSRANISGLSVVALVIDTKGRPQHVHTVLPLGYGMDDEAVKAVQQYRFEPAKLEGKAVPVQITIEVNFHR